jgi:putative membrane protein
MRSEPAGCFEENPTRRDQERGVKMYQFHRLPWMFAVGGAFRFLIFVGLLVLIVAGIWALIRSARRMDLLSRSVGSGSMSATLPKSNSALDILQERYARGDITKEEYDQIKQDLTS